MTYEMKNWGRCFVLKEDAESALSKIYTIAEGARFSIMTKPTLYQWVDESKEIVWVLSFVTRKMEEN